MTAAQAHVLAGNDAMSALIDIYLCGMASGAASMAITLGIPEAIADEASDRMCDQIVADPIALEEIRRQIAEVLTGQDSGPKTLPMTGAGQ